MPVSAGDVLWWCVCCGQRVRMRLFFTNLLFFLIVPGTVGVYVPLLVSGRRPFASGVPFVLGWILLVLGLGCLTWCIWAFARYGRGTPAPPMAPEKLVTKGLYRYSRNPMYLGVLIMIAGWAVVFGDWRLVVYLAFVAAALNAFAVLYEERRLQRQFGAEYLRYKERVGRWSPHFRRRD